VQLGFGENAQAMHNSVAALQARVDALQKK
jgi:hypothetical protein